MKKPMFIVVGVVVVVVIVAGVVLYWQKQSNFVATGDVKTDTESLCMRLRGEGWIVSSYTNVAGVIGGFSAHNQEYTGGTSYYYDATGREVISGSGVQFLNNKALSKKLSDWNERMKQYTIEEQVSCSEVGKNYKFPIISAGHFSVKKEEGMISDAKSVVNRYNEINDKNLIDVTKYTFSLLPSDVPYMRIVEAHYAGAPERPEGVLGNWGSQPGYPDFEVHLNYQDGDAELFFVQ